MPEALLFVGLALATFVITYVVTTSDFPPADRFRVLVSKTKSDTLLTLFTCPWCFSAYPAAAGVAIVDQWFQPLTMPVLWWFMAWGAAAALAAVTYGD